MDLPSGGGQQDSAAALVWPLFSFGALPPTTTGLFANGVEFTSSTTLGQSLQIGSSAALAVDYTTSPGISFWFWIKVLSYAANGVAKWFIDTSDIAHTSKLNLAFNCVSAVSGSFSLDHVPDVGQTVNITGSLNFTLNTWHMIAVTYDKTHQTLNIYVDGALVSSVADTNTYLSFTQADMVFGNRTTGGTGNMDFVGDEMGLCQSGVLTATQVTGLWNANTGYTWPGVEAIVPYP